MLLQLSLSLSVALLGTLVTFALVLAHQRTLIANATTTQALLAKQVVALAALQSEVKALKEAQVTQAPEPEPTPICLTDDQEKILVFVSKQQPIPLELIVPSIGMGAQIVLHHLEVMRESKLVREYWRDKEWSLLPAGRQYLFSRSLIS